MPCHRKVTSMHTIHVRALALALSIPLAACNHAEQSDAQANVAAAGSQAAATPPVDGAASSEISGEIQKAMQEAKQDVVSDLNRENINVNSVHVGNPLHGGHDDKDPRPKAEISPQGDLLIAGKKVTATAAQQALLLDYRRQIVGIVEAGMDVGAQGASLGVNAAKQALWSVLAGKDDKAVEASIKPQTDKIEAAAAKLCLRLPDLLSTQQKLAAAVPAFVPYATMQQKDVDDCGKDGQKGITVFSD